MLNVHLNTEIHIARYSVHRLATVWSPEGDVLDPELPGVGVQVHVGGEALVVGVALHPVRQQVDVSVAHPRHRPEHTPHLYIIIVIIKFL